MTPLERDIEKSLGRMIGRHGGMCLKWVCPGWAGVPDRIILLPGGVIMFAELKRPKGGVISPQQKWWADKLARLGFRHLFIFGHEDVKSLEAAIVDWLPPHTGYTGKCFVREVPDAK